MTLRTITHTLHHRTIHHTLCYNTALHWVDRYNISRQHIHTTCKRYNQPTNPYSPQHHDTRITTELLQSVPSPTIHILGSYALRKHNTHVTDVNGKSVHITTLQLHKALYNFRQANGFGRAMAAPQIGHNIQCIALQLGSGYTTMYNAQIIEIHNPNQRIVMWDDCLSIPWLYIRRQRYQCITVQYTDYTGQQQIWHQLPVEISELLQHEIDHLNGILTTDQPFTLPLNRDNTQHIEGVVGRDQYNSNKQYYDAMVDYVIKPTI